MTLPNTTLGITFACFDGPDARFSLAQTDRQILLDEVYHRLTADTVLGDSDAAQSFGRDVRRLAGQKMNATDVAELGPTLSAILQQSGRVEHADVTAKQLIPSPGLIHLGIGVVVTARNPITGEVGETFSFLFLLTPDTFEQIGDS